ncbi:MAG: hypothetical protein ACOY3P_23450 [Planctomycetota bacterium]
MQRLIPIAVSFAVVLLAYLAYSAAVVPWIEPAAAFGTHSGMTLSSVRGGDNPRLAPLRELFPPGSWELQNPKILESDQLKLLIGDYRTRPDGSVEIRPCTMILLPEGIEDDYMRHRQAVVMQAPAGAVLRFDRPLNLSLVDVGRLVGAQIVGAITIRGQGRSPAADDDLSMSTRDIQMNEQEIWTPHAVQFRYGGTSGLGRQLRIKLQQGRPPGRSAGPSVGGIELVEISRVERLHLELGGAGGVKATPMQQSIPDAAGAASGSIVRRLSGAQPAMPGSLGIDPNLPLEVTCQGPFRCDLVNQVATFEDRVNVWRVHPVGPSDQMNCELLAIYFAGGPAGSSGPAPPDAASGDSPSRTMQVTRIEARGNPVVISAPSEKVYARGQRVEHDLVRGRTTLESDSESVLQREHNEIHARTLFYQAAATGKLGEIFASGPGWIRGQMGERPDQKLFARWNEKLRVQPQEQSQVISLTGGAAVGFDAMGEIAAREIHFWLHELPQEKQGDAMQLLPDRMLALTGVAIQSQQLTGALEERMEIWFEPAGSPSNERWRAGQASVALAPPRILTQYRVPRVAAYPTGGSVLEGAAAPGGAGGRGSAASASVYAVTPVAQGGGAGEDAAGGDLAAPAAASHPLPAQAAGRSHFEIRGRRLRARVALPEHGEAELVELLLEDDVEFKETQTAQPGERPIRITGKQVHAIDAMRPHAAVTVVGEPAKHAHFEGRGLGLTGPNINLNRGVNRLWVDGGGRMDVPIDRDLQGQPLAVPSMLSIDFQKRMEFDGLTARFEQSVVAGTPAQRLMTETLEVIFREPIRFAEGQPQPDAQPKQILCRGGVSMESRTIENGQQVRLDRMQMADLGINLLSGAMTGGGPGWLVSVFHGDDSTLPGQGASGFGRLLPAEREPKPADPNDPGLRCLHVHFRGAMSGNLLSRSVSFERVRTVYAPVRDWMATLDEDDPARLGPGGVIMRCDRLTVNQMTTPLNGRQTVELEADGNIKVDGQGFSARGLRMTYAEAKDLLVLEGDGRTDAELFHQRQVGGEWQQYAARKLLFCPQTSRYLGAIGARTLQLSGLSGE